MKPTIFQKKLNFWLVPATDEFLQKYFFTEILYILRTNVYKEVFGIF